MWLKTNGVSPALINLDDAAYIELGSDSDGNDVRVFSWSRQRKSVYKPALQDDNGNTTTRTQRRTESLHVFDYIQWCIEGEKTIAVARPFLCDLSGTIPSKPFTFNPASSSSDDDESDDDDY